MIGDINKDAVCVGASSRVGNYLARHSKKSRLRTGRGDEIEAASGVAVRNAVDRDDLIPLPAGSPD